MASEADKEWTIELALTKRGWWAAGYIYRGEAGTHQGQFVPVHHFPVMESATAFVDAMKQGYSRYEARALAEQDA